MIMSTSDIGSPHAPGSTNASRSASSLGSCATRCLPLPPGRRTRPGSSTSPPARSFRPRPIVPAAIPVARETAAISPSWLRSPRKCADHARPDGPKGQCRGCGSHLCRPSADRSNFRTARESAHPLSSRSRFDYLRQGSWVEASTISIQTRLGLVLDLCSTQLADWPHHLCPTIHWEILAHGQAQKTAGNE